MKRNLRFIISSLLMLLCSAVGRAATGDTYKLVTNASELKSGDVVVIASGTHAMKSINSAGTKIDPIDVTITDNVLAWVDGMGETVLESTGSKWYIKFDGKYLNSKIADFSGASLNFTELPNSSRGTWSLSLSADGTAAFQNSYRSRGNKYLNYGSNFGFGGSGNVQIYKKQRRANGIKALSERVSASLSNGTLQLPISNPNSLPLTYTSSDEYVATVGTDGKATLKSWGTTTITATFAGSTTYEQGTVSLALTVTDTKDGYANKIIDFVAETDKGSTTSVDNADSMEKDVVTVHSNNAALASSPYELRYNRGLDIEVAKGRIVRVDIEGDLGNLVYSDGGGQYDKISDGKHVWTGSAKKVSVKHKGNTAFSQPVEITSIRVYVEYPEEKYVQYDENSDNAIEPWENTTVNLTRNLTGGQWNTLCLPFDLDEQMVFEYLGEGAKIAEYDTTDGDGTLSFKTVKTIEAGKPYLVKPVHSPSVYTFENLEIKTATPVQVGGDIKFQGLFSPKDITEGGTVKAAGVTGGAAISFVKNDGSKTKAFRAYFTVPATTAPSELRLSIDGTVTAISGINAGNEADATDAPVYNMQGQRVDGRSLPKGVYIKNGRKFVVAK